MHTYAHSLTERITTAQIRCKVRVVFRITRSHSTSAQSQHFLPPPFVSRDTAGSGGSLVLAARGGGVSHAALSPRHCGARQLVAIAGGALLRWRRPNDEGVSETISARRYLPKTSGVSIGRLSAPRVWTPPRQVVCRATDT